MKRGRKQMNLKDDQKALSIYDIFKGQSTGTVSDLLEKNSIISKKVPVNKTDLLQLLDLSVNKCSKCFLLDRSINTKLGMLMK